METRFNRLDWTTLGAVTAIWLAALLCHIGGALLAGMAGFALTRWICTLPWVRRYALVRYVVGVVLALSPLMLGRLVSVAFGHYVSGIAEQVVSLWHHLLQTLVDLRPQLPESAQAWVPTDPAAVQQRIIDLATSRSAELFAAGRLGLGMLLHTVVGWLLGIVAAVSHNDETPGPLLAAWNARWSALGLVFGRVARGQAWVAMANAAFTAVFVLVVAPIAGWHFPFRAALILVTLIASLIPVAGNLIANGMLLLIGFDVSPGAALAAMIFMIFVHKMEYLISARILGSANHTSAWELIAVMLTGELLFGPVGLVAATIIYPYVKLELREAGLV